VELLAVDQSILDKPMCGGLQEYARENGELPVFRFRMDLKLKSLNVVVQDKSAEDVPLMIADEDDEP
jgi:hypothetical protein